MKPRKPQWDDWRCYRCGRWQPAGTGTLRAADLPTGRVELLICDDCAANDEAVQADDGVGER